MHTRVGAAGFFSIHLRWLIHDGRNTLRLSLAMDKPQWSTGLLCSGSMLGIRIRKSLIMLGCITESIVNMHEYSHDLCLCTTYNQ